MVTDFGTDRSKNIIKLWKINLDTKLMMAMSLSLSLSMSLASMRITATAIGKYGNCILDSQCECARVCVKVCESVCALGVRLFASCN